MIRLEPIYINGECLQFIDKEQQSLSRVGGAWYDTALYALTPAQVAMLEGAEPEPSGLRFAAERLLTWAERQDCQHEETYRGGFIWTICHDCGRKWADDKGGFVPYQGNSCGLAI